MTSTPGTVVIAWDDAGPSTQLRPAPGHPDGAIDVHLQLHGLNACLHGVSPDLAVTLGADPDRPLLRVAPELVPAVVACLRSVLEALESL